jgi:hypothetical protein
MISFDVRFIKALCDDTGHEHAACQGELQVNAATTHEALQMAETEFCSRKNIIDWTLFADAIEIRRAACPNVGLLNGDAP